MSTKIYRLCEGEGEGNRLRSVGGWQKQGNTLLRRQANVWMGGRGQNEVTKGGGENSRISEGRGERSGDLKRKTCVEGYWRS